MKIRFWFCKTGLLRFISHLDTNRTMIRALRMANIPVAYSLGFNPRPLLTFALPLSVGIESKCETMDVVTSEDIDPTEAMERLNKVLPPLMRISEAAPAVTDPKFITSAKYELLFEGVSEGEFAEFAAQPQMKVMKRTKSGESEVDIKDKCAFESVNSESGKLRVIVTLPSGSADNLNAGLIPTALDGFCCRHIECAITRLAVYDKEGKNFR